MKLSILGGGGFRVPLVYGALLRDTNARRVDRVSLHDVDEVRLAAVMQVLDQMGAGVDGAPVVSTTTDLDSALDGADFVFSAIRVGGLEGRTRDERVALDLGLLGQETTGPGGLAYGLRTVPVAVEVAERIAVRCPDAWVINFTNPAGMITEAMQQVLGDRVVGICDSPIGLGRRAAQALGYEADADAVTLDYVGLNHLGWLHAIRQDGRDVLPDLIGDPQLLATIEEGRLFGTDWIQALGCLPNEYLYYYYFTREAVSAIRGDSQTRGEFLLSQQSEFYRAVAAAPDRALTEWRRVRAERDATYMQEGRADDEGRDKSDVQGGGYEGLALAIMAAIARNERSAMILNVRNGSAVPGLPPDAVVEIPCTVDQEGPRPLPTVPVPGEQLGLMQQIKAVEQLTIAAARTGSATLALKAFALHPLVDSVTTAKELLAGYRKAVPDLHELVG